MKKKTLFLSLVASALFVTSLASCDELNNNKNTTTTVVEPTTSEPTTKPSEPTQTVQYNLEDNEVSQKVFNEYKKEYPDASYNDFLLNGNKFQNSNNTVSYFYKARIDITLDSANNFVSKAFFIKDNNDKTVAYKYSEFVNNEWIETKNGLYFNEQLKFTSYITLSDGTFNRKFEYTYDEDGNMTTESASKYVNNEWIKVEEYVYINNEKKETYHIYLNQDGTFDQKQEYTYDENGNELTEKISNYKNNEWVKEIEAVYINNERKLTYYERVDTRGINVINVKEETTYDENGNKLTYKLSQCINNEWVKTKETKTFNGVEKELYLLTFNDNGTIATKEETTYDENGKSLNKKVYRYINNDWVLRKESTFINDVELDVLSYTFRGDSYKDKSEYTYDANGNQLSWISSSNQNGTWVYVRKKGNTYTENGNLLTESNQHFDGNSWVFDSSLEYTYDANGMVTFTHIKYRFGEYYTKTVETITGEKLTSTLNLKYENDNWIETSKSEYTYDSNGNQLTTTTSTFVNNEWVKTYESNRFGNELKCTYLLDSDDNGEFTEKYEWTYDENGNRLTSTSSKYLNGEWVKIGEYIGNDGKTTLQITLNDDNTFNTKHENTYDENEHVLTYKESKYINNEWIKISECVFINKLGKTTYSLTLNDDNTFNSKYECTYDENGNELTRIDHKYLNGEWVKTKEYKNENILYRLRLKDDGTFDTKEEWTYDENGKELTSTQSKYINNEWVKTNEYKYFGNVIKTTYSLSLNDDNTFKELKEYTFNDNGKMLSVTTSRYMSNNWVRYTVYDYTYDESGNETTFVETTYDSDGNKKTEKTYVSVKKNGIWESVHSVKYINNEPKDTLVITLCGDTYNTKSEYTYDESNGDRLTEVNYQYFGNTWVKIYEAKRINGELKATYNAAYDGEKITLSHENTYDNESGYLISQIVAKYDENKKELVNTNKYDYTYVSGTDIPASVTTYIPNNGAWYWDEKFEYTYDANNNLSIENDYIYKNGGWALNKIIESEYDSNGVLLYDVVSTIENEVWVKEKEEYTHNDKGRVSVSIIYDYKDNDWAPRTKKEYTYNDAGRLTGTTIYEFKDGDWVLKA